ncbi:sulfatase family protein [Poriferisphaera sp. WC338]|uniref:sulfatase family protein n=1 Tax=Poriferisphaera sp. WC338 TaxID=3425129 RepID=UPI003D81BB16
MTTCNKPNLLLITSDQQHWATIGMLNPKIKTPNLDRLARLGVHFNRAYCPNPTCTPTRASLITGLYPSAHGAFTLGTKLPEHIPTLGGYLRVHGYDTALIGKAHFQPLRSTDECQSVEAYPTLRDTEFWSTFNDTHTPWYGFDYCELTRNHTDEGHVGQHYALWMEENGLDNWRAYFQPRSDNHKDTDHDATRAPQVDPDSMLGLRKDDSWQLPESFHYTAWTGQKTISAIKRSHAQGKPFFIWSSYHDPHPPYCVSEPWASMYNPKDMDIDQYIEGEMDEMPLPHQLTRESENHFAPFNQDGWGNHGYHPHADVTREQLQRAKAIYYGMISFMDYWIGQTLDELEANGQLENTLIVFTSDHGHFIGEHGLIAKGPFHYEDLIKVPFICAWKNQIPHQSSNHAIQSLVDLAPTFLEAAGLEVPRHMQGRSQLKAWKQQAQPSRNYAIVENHHQAGPEVHLQTLITDRYKLTVYRGREWGELFDLLNDPSEHQNLYTNPSFKEVKTDMYRQLVQANLEREQTAMPRVCYA